MVHRLLERYLAGGRSVNHDKLEELCKHSSSMEQLAAGAERASIKYKQVEYLADRLGELYDGVISGVTEPILWFLSYIQTCALSWTDPQVWSHRAGRVYGIQTLWASYDRWGNPHIAPPCGWQEA